MKSSVSNSKAGPSQRHLPAPKELADYIIARLTPNNPHLMAVATPSPSSCLRLELLPGGGALDCSARCKRLAENGSRFVSVICQLQMPLDSRSFCREQRASSSYPICRYSDGSVSAGADLLWKQSHAGTSVAAHWSTLPNIRAF